MSKKQLSADPDYEVGYGNPPKETRFKKGQSGNPCGRPRGSKNKAASDRQLEKIILSEAYRLIKVNEESGHVYMSLAQAVMRSISVNAAKGDYRSQKLLTQMVQTVETTESIRKEKTLGAAISYMIDAENELQRRKQLGIKGPEIIPHPYDINIDPDTDEICINGPASYGEKEHFENLYSVKKRLQGQLFTAEDRIEDDISENERAKLEKSIRALRPVVRKLEKQLRGWAPKDP